MKLREQALAALGGMSAGLAGGLLGVGGGIVLVPILAGRFRLSQHAAHGTSLAVVGATALASLVIYGSHNSVQWRTAAWVALASVFTVHLGVALAGRLSSTTLQRAFAVLLVAVAVRLWWPTGSGALVPPGSPDSPIALELLIGAGVGLLAGFMGVGGGLIAVPAFVLLLGMPQRVAQGTSLAVILATAPIGTWSNARRGQVSWPLIPPLALGAALGGIVAASIAHRLPQATLVRLFAVFLLLVAAQSWRRAGGRASAAR
ncbi:MAG: sulfite exporter TauE/SafE family protein [Candidatus Eiseniibacteriota bacterium]